MLKLSTKDSDCGPYLQESVFSETEAFLSLTAQTSQTTLSLTPAPFVWLSRWSRVQATGLSEFYF